MSHMRCFGVLLLVASVLAPAMAATKTATLNPSAQKIYNKLKARSDIATICNNKQALASATRSTVRSMFFAGEISGRPRQEARAAAKQIFRDCSRLRTSSR